MTRQTLDDITRVVIDSPNFEYFVPTLRFKK